MLQWFILELGTKLKLKGGKIPIKKSEILRGGIWLYFHTNLKIIAIY